MLDKRTIALGCETYPARAQLMGLSVFLFFALFHVRGAHGEEISKPPAVRDVTPPGINRIYQSLDAPSVADSGQPKFMDVQVLPDGALRSGAVTIQLYGIVLPERKKLCISPEGQRWACGITAFIALRNLVQSRSIACKILSDIENRVLGQCKVEQTDISAWLLQEGWAETAPGVNEKLYVEAATSAKSKAIGLWGNIPPENSDKPQKRR